MKVVVFRDGMFGVRRWSWWFFKYEFLDLKIADTLHWWRIDEGNGEHTRGTKPQAKTALHVYAVRCALGTALRDVRSRTHRIGPPR